jgi:hypothetical protein
MRRPLLRVLEIALFPTIALVVVLVALPDRRELALHVWELVLLAAALLAALEAIHASFPPTRSGFDVEAVAPEALPRFASLSRLEREVSMSTSSAYDVHVRLRPALREIAAGLLLARRGIDLDRAPARAREAIGDDAWELVRGDRPAPADGRAPGVELARLDRIVTTLEQL